MQLLVIYAINIQHTDGSFAQKFARHLETLKKTPGAKVNLI